jgi:hypothetical protein
MNSRPICMKLLAAGAFAALGAAPATSAEIDQAVMMKWATVVQINYAIVGEYDGPHTRIVTGGGGVADEAAVKDRVEIDLRWDQTTAQLVGTPTFKNFKSDVVNPRNAEPKCAPPVLTSPYEHYTIEKLENGLGGALQMTAARSYAGASVTTFCTGARVTVPAKVVREPTDFVVPGAMLLAMPAGSQGPNVTVNPTASTIVTKDGKGWTWTFKLTPAK